MNIFMPEDTSFHVPALLPGLLYPQILDDNICAKIPRAADDHAAGIRAGPAHIKTFDWSIAA
jgi:hypothetical protein